MSDLIGDLFEKVVSFLVRRRVGVWILIAFLLVLSIGGFTTFSGQPQEQALTLLLTAVVSGVCCLALLIYAIRFERLRRRVDRERREAEARTRELLASGQMLPIPPLPQPRKDISAEEAGDVEEYARRMASVPWGDVDPIAAEQAHLVFDQVVARVRRVRGDVRELAEPIDICVRLPRPLCFAGAAEVMYRLSYLRWRTYVPEGLRQGLRFVARAQYHDPQQPDTLVVQTRLLAGSSAPRWLELAEKALVKLKQVAPDHRRLPDAEAAVHIQRGNYEAALACLDRAIAMPPSTEEAYVALSNKVLVLIELKRYDEASTVCDIVLALDPADPWTWHNKSLILYDLGQYDEALRCNERALAIMEFAAAQGLRRRILEQLAAPEGRTPPDASAPHG